MSKKEYMPWTNYKRFDPAMWINTRIKMMTGYLIVAYTKLFGIEKFEELRLHAWYSAAFNLHLKRSRKMAKVMRGHHPIFGEFSCMEPLRQFLVLSTPDIIRWYSAIMESGESNDSYKVTRFSSKYGTCLYIDMVNSLNNETKFAVRFYDRDVSFISLNNRYVDISEKFLMAPFEYEHWAYSVDSSSGYHYMDAGNLSWVSRLMGCMEYLAYQSITEKEAA